MRYFSAPPCPTIVDIGAYIGDFSIYAAKYLNARVVAYEPALENFAVLEENIRINSLENRIDSVNKAVSCGGEIILNVKKNDQEIHASAYRYDGEEKRRVQSITLDDLFRTHDLTHVDLLKVDCEGGEYEIFERTPEKLFAFVKNIVFEYHAAEGYQAKLTALIHRLERLGYTVKRHGMIVYAYRD